MLLPVIGIIGEQNGALDIWQADISLTATYSPRLLPMHVRHMAKEVKY